MIAIKCCKSIEVRIKGLMEQVIVITITIDNANGLIIKMDVEKAWVLDDH